MAAPVVETRHAACGAADTSPAARMRRGRHAAIVVLSDLLRPSVGPDHLLHTWRGVAGDKAAEQAFLRELQRALRSNRGRQP